jgi:hypothetical protein
MEQFLILIDDFINLKNSLNLFRRAVRRIRRFGDVAGVGGIAWPCAISALQCSAALYDFLPAGTYHNFQFPRLNTSSIYCGNWTDSGY